MASNHDSTLAPGAAILLTGVNGFIGSHVADQLLRAGYSVRGVARNPAAASWMTDYLDKKYGEGKFQVLGITDFTAPGAFDSALKGISLSLSLRSWLFTPWQKTKSAS